MQIKSQKISLSSYLLLSIYLLSVTAYIEFLNYQAGGILPRSEYYNNDPKQGHVKWRYRSTTDLNQVTALSNTYANNSEQIPAASDANAHPNALIANHSDIAEARYHNSQAQKENHLHRVVVRLGLPQYPLLLLAFVLFFVCLCNSMKPNFKAFLPLIGFCFAFNLASLIALFVRDYFGSLGW